LMGRGIVEVLGRTDDMKLVGIADVDRNALQRTKGYAPKDAVFTTDSFELLKLGLDVLVEATSTILQAALLVSRALEEKVNVVLMNSELDQMFGRLLAMKAEANGVIVTSDAGDQHGVLTRIIEEVRGMGFEVVMAGNNKGFLDRYASPESVREEAAKRRLSLRQCTAYTDGTKLAIEMAILANAVGFSILQKGMMGPRVEQVEDALRVFDLTKARRLGGVVDYVVGAKPGGSVFVIGCSDDQEDQFYMDYYKMGKGPFYLFTRPYHLCHFETPLAIRRIMQCRKPVLVQKRRILDVACRAKTTLEAGTRLEGIGGHHLYGILDKSGCMPIGIVEGAVLLNRKEKDQEIGWRDVRFPDGDLCLALWREQHGLET